MKKASPKASTSTTFDPLTVRHSLMVRDKGVATGFKFVQVFVCDSSIVVH